jgi:ribonuclease HI
MNTQACLQPALPQTNQAAQVQAAIEALNRAQEVTDIRQSVFQIVLFTNSSYLVKSISEHVWNWVENGWRNYRGKEVANRRAFEHVHPTIEGMEAGGINVEFWLVPRNYNRQADRLTNLALDAIIYSAASAHHSASTPIEAAPVPTVTVVPAWDYPN